MSLPRVRGLHHVTCVGGAPQDNFAFYSKLLGLRLVKTTVHFDNADVYHLYYGDYPARPGSILTFFPFPSPSPGLHGAGAATNTTFAVPVGSQDYWEQRLADRSLNGGWEELLGEPVFRFRDDDGQELRLAACATGDLPQAPEPHVASEHAIQYIRGLDFIVRSAEPTLGLLTEVLGLQGTAEADGRVRLSFPDDPGAFIDLVLRPDAPSARQVPLEGVLAEAGTVNHVALEIPDEGEQLQLGDALKELGFELSPVKDRQYFKSIYFLDTSGIRLEIATSGPGFAIDEDPEHLGQELKLPPWLEDRRPEYESTLPPLDRGLDVPGGRP